MKSYAIIRQVLGQKPYFRYFLWLWFATVSLFLWVVKINLLVYIASSPILTFVDKIDYILDAYVNFLRIDNPVALSRIVLSLLLAVSLTLMVYVWQTGEQRREAAKGNGGALVAMVSMHCVACGTSLAAPLITALAGSGAYYFSTERYEATQIVGTGANILGIIIVLWAISGMIKRIALSGLLRPERQQAQGRTF